MSSIAIAGDTSGSITLQAPAIAGTNTVTLPATTGYLFVTPTSGTLNTSSGGTGLTSFTSGGAMYATSTSALTTGTLPIASGGTNSTATPTAGGVVYGSGTAQAYTAAGTSGQYLQSQGSGAPIWASVSGGLQIGMQKFVYTGSAQTFTVPTGITAIFVQALGGGAGGAGCTRSLGGAGGGAGAFGMAYITGLTPGGTVTVTIGAGGTAGSPGGAGTGGAGGTTSFGTYISCTGGAGGTANGSGGVGGAGGSCTITGATNIWALTGRAGNPGGPGCGTYGGGDGAAGTVYNTAFGFGQGGGGAGQTSGSTPGGVAFGNGAGGGGAAQNCGSNVSGGAGTSGFVIVTW
jgi:hypothetical protein